MQIVFTNHAKYRISERKISVSNVRQTIKNPDKKNVNDYGMMEVTKRFGRKSLQVVCKVQANKMIVITAYEN